MERSERTTAAIVKFGDDILKLWEPEDLFTVARQVEETMATPGWIAVLQLAGRAKDRAEARLIHQGSRAPEAQLRHDLGLVAAYDELFMAAHAIVEGAERLRNKFAAESAAGGEQ